MFLVRVYTGRKQLRVCLGRIGLDFLLDSLGEEANRLHGSFLSFSCKWTHTGRSPYHVGWDLLKYSNGHQLVGNSLVPKIKIVRVSVHCESFDIVLFRSELDYEDMYVCMLDPQVM